VTIPTPDPTPGTSSSSVGKAAPIPGGTRPPAPSGGVPYWMLGVAVACAGALGIVLGVKVGRSLGVALVEPTPVEKLRCAECDQRKAEAKLADDIAQARSLVSPDDISAMLERQRAVENAVD